LTIADYRVAPFLFSLCQPAIEKMAGFKPSTRLQKYAADFEAACGSASFMKSAGGFSIAEYLASKTADLGSGPTTALASNKLALIYRFETDGEENALKIDGLVFDEALPKLKTVKGFEKLTRTVCKTEWKYEMSLVFDNNENFQAYKESDFRKSEILPILGKAIKEKYMKEQPYSGDRLYDERPASNDARSTKQEGLTSIPVSKVALVYYFQVDGQEEVALKLDGLLFDKVLPKLKTVKGFQKVGRTVCKTEWNYEFVIVFDSIENFKAYKDGDFRKNEILPVLGEAMKMMKDKPYSGDRVYDEDSTTQAATKQAPQAASSDQAGTAQPNQEKKEAKTGCCTMM
jgi:heme-degrading monooxygenase HmoA